MKAVTWLPTTTGAAIYAAIQDLGLVAFDIGASVPRPSPQPDCLPPGLVPCAGQPQFLAGNYIGVSSIGLTAAEGSDGSTATAKTSR